MLEKLKEEVFKANLELPKHGLVLFTWGNVSAIDREKGLVVIKPSGVDYETMKAEDMVVVDLDGNVVEGNRVPSSEWAMHIMPYKYRDDIDAVVHAHTMYSAVLACLREELPATHYMIAVAGPTVRVAKYATYGSKELAENAFEAMKDRKAVLLANHGILAGAKDILNAFNIVEEIEYCSEVYTKAKAIGEPVILPKEEMELMAEKFKTYGQRVSTKKD